MPRIDINIKYIKIKNVFKDTISISEWNSFIYFLKSIGLYEEFFELVDIEWINKTSARFSYKEAYYFIIESALQHKPPFYWTVISILNRLRCEVLYGEHYLENNFEYHGEGEIDDSFNDEINTVIELMKGCNGTLQEEKINRILRFIDYMKSEYERRWK